MSEKTLNASKKLILLRSRCAAIVLCVAILLCSVVLPARAAGIDYNDYITDVRVDGDNDIVTVSLPLSSLEWFCYDPDNKYVSGVGGSFTYSFNADGDYLVRIRAPLLDLTNIPSDTVVNLQYEFSLPSGAFVDSGNLTFYNYNFFYGNSGLITYKSSVGETGPGFTFSASFTIGSVSGATSVQIESRLAKFSVFNSSMGDLGPITFSTKQFDLVMTISSLYRLQQQTGKTNQLLNEVEKQLEAQGKTLDEVLEQQQQTNDKLDDMQGSIETLPGQIGDEMQGIIDNEKEESKGEGNKFVDQILDALPDPSTDVLAALKGLTDATAYTGTDAVLPIPAIVLPGIDGLFPETEIWGGAQFDFGEYISMLPSTLLTLVQSLFTIAIVLFCVYELKGVISYCLTLRESKGG